jgi:FKBP-type peptidyl-prolyl cis-trans isomerase SlyD
MFSTDPEGHSIVTVTAMTDDMVTVDGNHPLAGEALTFDVEVTESRDASEDELSHGHAHGAGGVQH